MSFFNWRGDRKDHFSAQERTEPFSKAPVEAEVALPLPPAPPAPHAPPAMSAAPPASAIVAQASFYRHWQAISAEGITASQFIEFLQPFADLDGISVSYVYSDADGNERIYNRRRDDTTAENPLTAAIKEKKISRDEALALARNEEGRVWIESNFMDLK